jgi:cyclopropane fatty-acyl-phospholipid synthase-like methyltransferase
MRDRRDFDSIQRVDLIKQMCVGKRVLHLGCTNYPYTDNAIASDMLLHFDLEKVASELWGIDADREGIEILERHGAKNIVLGDLESLDQCLLTDKFDVIVAGEVIEHINNPGLFLNGIKRFMDERTELIVTTVNAYCAMRFFYYGARGRRGKTEPIHPDHIAHYSYSTLKLLVERHGFRLEHFYFYDLGNEHRRFVPWYLRLVNDIFVTLVPQWSDGVIAICRVKQPTDAV